MKPGPSTVADIILSELSLDAPPESLDVVIERIINRLLLGSCHNFSCTNPMLLWNTSFYLARLKLACNLSNHLLDIDMKIVSDLDLWLE